MEAGERDLHGSRGGKGSPGDGTVTAILIEEQPPIAGPITFGTHIAQPLDQRHRPVEVLQPDDVALANLAGSFACNSIIDARTFSNASKQDAETSSFRVERECANTLLNGTDSMPGNVPDFLHRFHPAFLLHVSSTTLNLLLGR